MTVYAPTTGTLCRFEATDDTAHNHLEHQR